MKGTMMRMVAVGAMLAVLASMAPAAHAAAGDVVRSGSCSGSSHWKLKLKLDDPKIQSEFEVDQNVVGDTWRVRLFDGGTQVATGLRTTKAPSGSFTFTKLVPNLSGADRFVARARNLSTGETCVGHAAI